MKYGKALTKTMEILKWHSLETAYWKLIWGSVSICWTCLWYVRTKNYTLIALNSNNASVISTYTTDCESIGKMSSVFMRCLSAQVLHRSHWVSEKGRRKYKDYCFFIIFIFSSETIKQKRSFILDWGIKFLRKK